MKKRKSTRSTPDPFARGMQVRRKVLGGAHVDRATAAQTDFDADFQRFITETAWGAVWARPGLDLRTRHLITIAILAALGREHELELHLRRIGNTGTTANDVRELMLHVAAYAGIPAANSAMKLAKETFAATSSTVGLPLAGKPRRGDKRRPYKSRSHG